MRRRSSSGRGATTSAIVVGLNHLAHMEKVEVVNDPPKEEGWLMKLVNAFSGGAIDEFNMIYSIRDIDYKDRAFILAGHFSKDARYEFMYGRGMGSKVGKGILETSTGIGIKGFTKHGLNRAIERKVSPKNILNTIKNPIKINNTKTDVLGRQSVRFTGEKSSVIINPNTGKIISVNPVSSKKKIK